MLEQIELPIRVPERADVHDDLRVQVIAGLAAHALRRAEVGLRLRDGGVKRLTPQKRQCRLAKHALRDSGKVGAEAQVEVRNILKPRQPYGVAPSAKLG